jgi:hypothetical protein
MRNQTQGTQKLLARKHSNQPQSYTRYTAQAYQKLPATAHTSNLATGIGNVLGSEGTCMWDLIGAPS